jgi:hypothetical protein
VATPGPALRDFEAYWSAGATWNAGANPYSRAVWDRERTVPGVDPRRDELLPFVGPPATLLLWSLLARLPYLGAAAVWAALLGIALLTLVFVALRGAYAPITTRFVLAGCALAVSFGPLTSDVALGQLALPAFAAAALLVVSRSLWTRTAAACMAFAQPNASAGLISQLGRNRTTAALLLGLVATYALGALAAGWQWPWMYALLLVAHSGAERFSVIQITPSAIAYGFGASPPVAMLAATVAATLAIAAAIVVARQVRDSFARFAAFSALLPFVAGFVHEHDLLVAYGAAAWCAIRTRGTARAVALGGTLLVAIDWLGLAQRPTGIVQCALLASAVLFAFTALGERAPLRAQFVPVALVALLFIAAAALATRHPAPIWPDALTAFHAPAAASVAEVWRDEQRAAGLLDAVAPWALLRSLSLTGCALLAYAICRRSTSDRTA